MSGGSMNYLYNQVAEASFNENTILRRAFRKHLEKVSKALRSIEWNDSCDGDKFEEENIRACLHPIAELNQAIEEGNKALGQLKASLEWAMNLDLDFVDHPRDKAKDPLSDKEAGTK